MPILTLKQKIIAVVAIIGAVLILIFQQGLYSKNEPSSGTEVKNEQVQNENPDIIATNPSPLDQSVILPTQSIELNFNYPLENIPEFKHKIEPKVDYKIELSTDRKTAKIIPTTSFGLGMTYTLFIAPETKFDGNKTLGKEIIYHFKTIEYKGI